MWWSIILFLINILSVMCDSCSRNEFSEGTFFCHQRQHDESVNCRTKIPNITNLDVNKKDGTVDVEFTYEFGCNYSFVLRYLENKAECNTANNNIDDTHTEYKYMYIPIVEENNRTDIQYCQKKGRITLKYIFTGCYTLSIKDDEQLLVEYFETSYKKKVFIDDSESLIVTSMGVDNTTQVVINHTFLTFHPRVEVTLEEMENTTNNVRFKLNPSTSMPNKFLKYCVEEIDNINVTCESKTEKSIECIIHAELNPGTYKVSAVFYDIHKCPVCENCGIWTYCEMLRKKIISTTLPPTSIPVIVKTNDNVLYSVLIIICLLIILIIGVLYQLRKKPNPDPSNTAPVLDEEALIGQTKVFLLYAKDDEAVMKTMAAFRQALRTEGIEVCDIYDSDQQMSINENHIKWITDKLTDKSMKTIIPLTYCGEIIANFPNSAEKIYKKPSNYDSLYSYAISLITRKVDPDSYTKLFIVDMGFDKIKYTKFSFLNPSTRYSLPVKFKELVRDLRCKKGSLENISHNCNMYNEFIRKHEEMLQIVDNMDYLKNILKVKVYDNDIQVTVNGLKLDEKIIL